MEKDTPHRATGADSRRPVASRHHPLIQRIASALVRARVTPNAISLASMAAAGAGAAALVWGPPWAAWPCALGIQLRLLCNLFDGMVAVEGGQATATGVLYNEVPDRVSDSVLLVALGVAAGHPGWGWAAALLAVGTAYVRTLGGALGRPLDFRGPMAKQHRMAVMTVACVLAPLEWRWAGSTHVLWLAAVVITAGAALTCATRLRAIARNLRDTA